MYKALYKDRSTLWAMFLVNAGKNIQNSLKIPSICMGMDIRKKMEHDRIHKEQSNTIKQNIKNHQDSPILRCLRQAALRRFAVNTAFSLRSPLQAAREGTQLRGLKVVPQLPSWCQ